MRVDSGQWAVGSGQWVAGSGLWVVKKLKLPTVHYPLSTIHYPLSTIFDLLQFAFDRNAAVGRNGANGLAAAAEVERQIAFDLSLQGDREISLQSAVDRAGLKVGRIIFGD